MRAIIDFPNAFDSNPTTTRLVFRDPVDVVYAYDIADVVPALERVAAAAASGLWAAGFITYEAAPAFEPAVHVRVGSTMPLLAFGLYATSTDSLDPASGAHASVVRRPPTALAAPAWSEQTSEARFNDALAAIRQAIIDGETYQVNYTNRLLSSFSGDSSAALSWYESLRAAQGAGWHAFIETDAHTILSASPELFFERRANRIATRPMKGTTRRGRWLREDEEMKATLLASSKERAENLMIVDLLRNDVGRIARTGTVEVPQLFTPERYETVWQLTSRVEATLADGTTLVDIFRALFPCGSVTGAPKINTMKWIADLEDSPREVYCGAIGVVRPGGDCAFNVPIRTVCIARSTSTASYGVGSGITIDSNAADELAEFRAKALVLSHSQEPFELLETMRMENGEILRLPQHLRRLKDSAEYFGYALDLPSLEHALREASGSANAGSRAPGSSWRVRVRVGRSGEFTVDASVPAPPRYATMDASRATGGILSIAVAERAVHSADPFLFNKTTRRDVYDRARASAPQAFDVLLSNERDEITEFTFGNVVVEIGGGLFTPAIDSGLLPGIFRAELLENPRWRVSERVIRVAELTDVTRMWLVNSLREWVEVDHRA